MDAAIYHLLTQLAEITEELNRKEAKLVGGLEKEIKKLGSQLHSVKAVVVDAEKRQAKEGSVRVWLQKLRDVSYDTDDVLDLWITEMRRSAEIGGEFYSPTPTREVWPFLTLPCLGCNRVALRRDIALKIKKINQRFVIITTEKDRYKLNEFSGSDSPNYIPRLSSIIFHHESEVKGRDVDKETLISKLLLSDKNQGNIVSIVGLGGIGKTTLAKVVYNSSDVIQHFISRFWVCVSDPFDEVRIARAILEDIEGSAPYLLELETVARKIRNYLQGKRFLLVLDDVWTEDFRKYEQLFNSLKTGAPGTTILVTTRYESVARVMGSSYQLHLRPLSDDDSWSLFEKIAFFDPKREECERFEEVGREITLKCRGLPLAIKNIASLMRFKNSLNDWQDVLSSEFWELEEAEGGHFPPLMLSYFDLPSAMRRCFSFCALFPKDHVIEANDLIQLWMAQGFLISTEKVEMEVIGQDYLQHLAVRSFFQDVVRDERDGERILSFQMHDLVHDFARYLNENDCSVIVFNNDFQQRMESSHRRVRHLTVLRTQDSQFPNDPYVENLFTLRVVPLYDSPPSIDQLDQLEPDFIRRAASLKALDLSRNRIVELPKEISNLITLKYLNLSYNPIWELPEALCDLYGLKTLKLSACEHLRSLPPRACKLVNLRHLEIDRTDSLKTLPKGIGNLRSLQCLSKFIIIRMNDRGDTCGLEDLKNLNNLRGRLRIEGLGHAADADEARKAELQKKIYLSDLEMDFSPSIQTGSQDEVIEALEVHENLKSLQISSYGGTKFPHWMMKLTNLQNLFLQDCQNCTNLPPLGRLPSLLTLHLEGMKTINCLGLEFLGVHVNNSNTTNGDGGSEALSAFPNLEKLAISKMENWEEWDVTTEDTGIFEANFYVMPRLRCLEVSYCSKLKELPPLLLQNRTLSKLHIDNCPLLLQRYNRETGEDWSKISHIPQLRIS